MALAIINYLFVFLYTFYEKQDIKQIQIKHIFLIITMVIMASFFHRSVLSATPIVLLIYIISKKNIDISLSLFFIIVVFFWYRFFYSKELLFGIMAFGGYFGNRYATILDEFFNEYYGTGHEIRISYIKLLMIILLVIIYYYYSKSIESGKKKMIAKMAIIISLLDFAVSPLVFANRLLSYVEVIKYVGYSYMFAFMLKAKYKNIAIPYIMIALYIHANNVYSYYSIYDYKTVFSKDCVYRKFYRRPRLDTDDSKTWNKRKIYITKKI